MRAAVVGVTVWFAGIATFADSVDTIGPRKSVQDSIAGVYVYIYGHNTTDLEENHTIVLETDRNSVAGLYYGTSDDFDDAREGYLPGFFVSPMRQLSIQNQTISFRIELRPDELFVKPIDRSIRSPIEVDRSKNRRWITDYQPGLKLSRSIVIYSGEIKNSEIHIKSKHGTRIFKKIK